MRTLFCLVLPLVFGCATTLEGSGPANSSGSTLTASGEDPTWYDDVGPLMMNSCASCHTEGGIGTFSMDTYEEAQPWAAAIAAALEDGTMPPWAATEDPDCTPEVWFMDDPRLTEDEIALVREWADNGAPPGAEKDLTVPAIDHVVEPNEVITLPEPFTVTGANDIYQCFRVELPLDSDVWITEMEVFPDNDAVVHHALVWSDPDNQSAALAGPDGSYPCSGEPGFLSELVGGWTPGAQPIRNPPNTGSLLKAGSAIVINMHYHPTGDTSEIDQTQVALKWTTEKPAQYVTYYMVDEPFGATVDDGEFKIPAGAEDHVETLSLYLPNYVFVPLPVFSVMPHMHYRGTDMKVTIEKASGDEECVIQTDGYRFDFQTIYSYDTQVTADYPTATAGDTIRVQCHYNNSWSNPFMQEALDAAGESDLVDVYWGEETGDEMCMAIVGLVIPPIDIFDYL